jgi:hypothetical protein
VVRGPGRGSPRGTGGKAPGPRSGHRTGEVRWVHVSAFQIVPGQEIAFADTHQTLDPQKKSIVQSIRYTATPDGATTVATTTLSATDQVESAVTLDCHLGKGAYFHW